MEILSTTMMQQVYLKKYEFHPRCKLASLTHLCFANDVLVFFFPKGDVVAASRLKTTKDFFSKCSGLQMNPQKTTLFYYAVDNDTLNQIIQVLIAPLVIFL